MSSIDFPPLMLKRAGWQRFSLPMPQGALAQGKSLSLAGSSGKSVAVQSRTLATWADGSVRWLDCQVVAIEDGEHTIIVGDAPVPEGAATVDENGAGILLGNDKIGLTLNSAGPSPISSIRMEGNEVGHADRILEANLRLSSADSHPFTSSADNQRKVEILERGPVRAVAVVTGRHVAPDGNIAMGYRLRIELIAGQSTAVLRYRFFHHDLGVDLHRLDYLSLQLRLREDAPVRRHVLQQHFGMGWQPREVQTARPVHIRSLADHPRVHVADASCLDDPSEYAHFLPRRMDSTRPYLGVSVPGGWATLHVQDFEELCPSSLTSEGAELTMHVWPQWAGELTVPQGRSRETTLRLILTPGDEPPTMTQVSDAVVASTDTASVEISAAHYRQCQAWHADRILPKSRKSARRFDRHLTRMSTMPSVIGMWDLGDNIDPGYSTTYTVVDSVNLVNPGVAPVFQAGRHKRLAPWSDEGQFERVWSNNEYDAMAALCREWLRGNHDDDLWQRLRWFARHAIEVDFVGYSDHPEAHEGTPAHSADHNRATAYPSHLWCEGLLAYYCVTGDDDALDVAVKQGDFIIRAFSNNSRGGLRWAFTRELGWALLHQATLADLTHEQRFLDQAKSIAEALIAEPLTDAVVKNMVVGAFGYASIAMGIEALWQVTGDKRLAQWLETVSGHVAAYVQNGTECVESCMILNYFSAAYAVSDDPKHLQPGMHILEMIIDGSQWANAPQFPKPVAMMHRSLARFCYAAHQHDMLSGLDYRFYQRGND